MVNILLTMLIVLSVYTTAGQRSRPIVVNTLAIESPAYENDIKLGDVILKIDGVENRRMEDIYDYTWYELPPKPHTYTVKRGDKILEFSFTAKERRYETKKGITLHHGQTGMVQLGALNIKKAISSINGIDVEKNPEKAREIIREHFDKELLVGLNSDVVGDKEGEDPFLMIFPARFNEHFDDPDHKHYKYVFLSDPENLLYVRLSLFEAIKRTSFALKKGLLVLRHLFRLRLRERMTTRLSPALER